MTIPDLVINLFSTWGYLIVFLGVFLESLFFTGWIAPGTAVLLLGGFFASKGDLNILLLAPIAIVAAIAGDSLGYLIGLKSGYALVNRFQDRFKMKDRIGRAQRYFEKYGGATVLFGRLISGLDAFIPLAAGISHMNYGRYLSFDIPGIVVWSVSLLVLGYYSGENWERIEKIVDRLGWAALLIVAGILLMIYIGGKLKDRLAKRRTDGGDQEDEGGQADGLSVSALTEVDVDGTPKPGRE